MSNGKYSRGTQSEAARREGVHRSTISRRVRDGKSDLTRVENDRRTTENINKMKRELGADE